MKFAGEAQRQLLLLSPPLQSNEEQAMEGSH